jgi:hypothetical protein
MHTWNQVCVGSIGYRAWCDRVQINLKTMNIKYSHIGHALSRAELKKIGGGGSFGAPGEPEDAGGDNSDIASRRCCWTSAPTTCSPCRVTTSNATCTSGAFITTSGC